jgi:hypothetical protein
MEIDRWLSLPSRLRLSKPQMSDYDDYEEYSAAYSEWLARVEMYEIACDLQADIAKEQRYETGS